MTAVPVDQGTSRPGRGELAAALTDQALLLALTAASLAALVVTAAGAGAPELLAQLLDTTLLQLWVLLSVFGLYVAVPCHRLRLRDATGAFDRAPGAWGRALRELRRTTLSTRRLVGATTAALSIALLFNVFAAWKRFYPSLAPFSWDAAFSRLDRALHAGRLPHEHLRPLLDSDLAVLALDRLYIYWAVVVGCSLVLWIWRPPSPDRQRVLAGLVFIKIGMGAVAATLFASAGPCFFGDATGAADPYAPHMSALRDLAARLPLQVPATQSMMWSLWEAGATPLYFGISAMPSLHVALPALFTFAAWRLDRTYALAMGAYTLLTLIATVLLGWHYAVDGYASIALVAAYWWLSGRIWPRNGASTRPSAA